MASQRTPSDDSIQFDEDEAEFISHTNFLFTFKECIALIREGERTLMNDTDFETPKEANILIEQGYTPIPF